MHIFIGTQHLTLRTSLLNGTHVQIASTHLGKITTKTLFQKAVVFYNRSAKFRFSETLTFVRHWHRRQHQVDATIDLIKRYLEAPSTFFGMVVSVLRDV